MNFLELWSSSFSDVLVQVLLAVLAILLIFYWSLIRQIQRISEWAKKVRWGETPPGPNRPVAGLLRSLTGDIAQMAKSLTVAKSAAEEEARLRHRSESIWTAQRLKEFIKNKLGGRPLFVVSNREPYRHEQQGKNVECVVPASGLVTAIEPILKACGGTWIAQGDGDADNQTVDENDRLRVPPEEPQYTLRRVWLDREEEEGFYYGFSNEGLWPLCHIAHTRPSFRISDWMHYQAVNRKFADSVLKEIEKTEAPCVLVQDYHFALIPELIKRKRPDARVGIFWHIPWPNPESFGICPWQKELLKGMLGADLIGFHTQFHCNNFIQTVDRFLESRIDYEHFSIHCEGRTTGVKPFPISVAFSEGPVETDRDHFFKSQGIVASWVGVGVDRLDYTKGILERFRGVETFLEKYPDYQGKFSFVQLAAPSRTLIPKYQALNDEVEAEAKRINTRFKANGWKAILLLKKHHGHKEILPFYKFADLCLVTALHDGMNLVAKEFVAARTDEKGVLILSQFTGAARELEEALLINPYDTVQIADAIAIALNMPLEEQMERMTEMRRVLKERNIYRWAADLVGELAQVRLVNSREQKAGRTSHEILMDRVG